MGFDVFRPFLRSAVGRCLSFVFAVLTANMVSAADDKRLLRMTHTIDELSARVTELKAENRRLEAALKQTIQANRSGTRVVSGCDVSDAKDQFMYENNPVTQANLLMNWMKRNGKRCNVDQLQRLAGLADEISLQQGEPIVKVIRDLLASL